MVSEPPYKRFPPDPPTRRNIWILIAAVTIALVLNLIHQTL